MALSRAINESGTLSNAAVPVAPYPGGKPYSTIATRRSATGLRRSSIQALRRPVSRLSRSGIR